MNAAQTQLLTRLRELVDETPESGALNAGGRPLQITRFSQAVEARAEDGPALVEYVKAKVHARPTASYSALVQAGRPDLTPEALAADPDAPWADEFNDEDRAKANERLGAMLEAHRQQTEAVEAKALEYDRKIVANVNARRIDKGRPALTPEQEATMLGDRAAERRKPE